MFGGGHNGQMTIVEFINSGKASQRDVVALLEEYQAKY